MQDRRTTLEQLLVAGLREQSEGECLEFDELWALVRRGRRARGYHRAVRHIGACPACRRTYLELRAIELMRRRQSRARLGQLIELPTVWILAAGTAAATIVVIALLLAPRGTQVTQSLPALAAPEIPIASVPPEARTNPTTPRLSSDAGRLSPPASTPLELEREFTSLEKVPNFVQSAVDAFVSAVASATRSAQPLSTQSPPIQLLSPDIERNAAIIAPVRTFEWRPVVGAEKYVVTIRADDWELTESLSADQTRYTLPPDKSLRHGGEYQLVLVAHRGREELVIKRRFRVLSEKRLPILEWAQQHERDLPIRSGMVYYYQLERFTDALRCFQQARQMYPDDARIEQYLSFVKDRIRAQEADF